MCIQFQIKSLITFIKTKNRRFLSLLKEIELIFGPNSIVGIPRMIEKTFFRNIYLAKKVGISHFWAFSEESSFFFLWLIKLNQGPLIGFRILRFSLIDEMNIFRDEDFIKKCTPILLLNNFPINQKKGLILKEIFENLFPLAKSNNIITKKILKVILIDYNGQNNTIKFRCYRIKRNLSLFPRKMRKKKGFFNKEMFSSINTKELIENKKISTKKMKSRLNLIRMEEAGPRINSKILEIFNKI
mmetsp:Transcript_17758/g.36417  ORF Transcript_17758/g.36417 Transcript_17758/m.36417 type:complete len:243 (+) Transcript_17758:1115-1843(+)